MKHYRIRGTSFELPGYKEFAAEDGWGYWNHPSGYQPMIPVEWVESYEPPRKEPPVSSVEIGSNGAVYVKISKSSLGAWLWIHPNGDTGSTTWELMQRNNSPTRPMEVVFDSETESEHWYVH